VTTTAPIQTTTTATTTSATDYYHEIGRSLSHDGTDYGKAKAVYDWACYNIKCNSLQKNNDFKLTKGVK
jgi:hypothetical protein